MGHCNITVPFSSSFQIGIHLTLGIHKDILRNMKNLLLIFKNQLCYDLLNLLILRVQHYDFCQMYTITKPLIQS